MTFYPEDHEKEIRRYIRATLYGGPYSIRSITEWVASVGTASHPKTDEERTWAWEEIALIEQEHPERFSHPQPEPAIMLEFDEVAI